MGCCGSKSGGLYSTAFQPREKLSYAASQYGSDGAQVGVSVAGMLTCLPLSQLSVVDIQPNYIFAALFDIHVSKHAAEFCTSEVLEVVAQQTSLFPANVSEALRQTFLRLDELFLASRAYSDSVKASSGASGTMVFLDRRMHRVHLGCSGGSNIVLGELVHGLAVQIADAQFLCPPVMLDSHTVCPVGTGRWKQQTLAEAYNRGRRNPADRVEWDGRPKQAAVHTVERQLTAVHESIIIGSPGLWGLASPDAAALRSHFYLRATADLDTQANNRAGDCAANTADHLVIFAEQQITDRLPRPAGADVVAMVLTFKWPANSINQAFTGKSMLESLQQYSTQQHAARAKRNWRMVRTLCMEYRRAHRRMVLQKWQRAVRLALAAGMKQARRLEEELWKRERMVVNVSPSLKVRNQKGQEVSLRAMHFDLTAVA
ncbi:g7953 [Coccomyxa elongata]